MTATQEDPLKGYRGLARSRLEGWGVKVWSDVEVTTTKGRFNGIILPRSETADDRAESIEWAASAVPRGVAPRRL